MDNPQDQRSAFDWGVRDERYFETQAAKKLRLQRIEYRKGWGAYVDLMVQLRLERARRVQELIKARYSSKETE